MFRTLFLLASFLYVASSQGLRGNDMLGFLNESDEWKQFSNFQDKFAKKYGSITELENRFQIFRTNLRNIIVHNLDRSQNFTMGVNQFTDLTPEEFRAQYVGGLKTEIGSYGCKSFSSSASGAPSSRSTPRCSSPRRWRTSAASTRCRTSSPASSPTARASTSTIGRTAAVRSPWSRSTTPAGRRRSRRWPRRTSTSTIR